LFHYRHNIASVSETGGTYLLVCNKADEISCELMLQYFTWCCGRFQFPGMWTLYRSV